MVTVASPERVVFSRDIFPRLCKAGGGALSVETLNAIPRDAIARERTRYIDYMEAALGEPLSGRVHLDKNPNHTSLLPGLLRLFEESRFIVALRDPRDVIVSCVLRMFRLTETSAMLLSWETACEMYRFEMETWLRYRDLLDADTWVEVRYEDVVADFEQQACRSLEAVGLSWDERIRDYRTQIINKHVNSPTHSEVRRPIHTDSIGLMLLTLPIILPVVRETGMDLVWFGIVVIKLLEIGLITPPVGLNVYVIKGALGNLVTLQNIFRGVLWFIAMDIVALAIIVLYPPLSLWLPGLMR